jgi:predicted hydrocarbon binding protein
MQPQVPIEVDKDTGVWTTDGLPMLYVPRHFFVNNHAAVEAALGRQAYASQLYDAGYRSAYYWCEEAAKTHGLKGLAVFAHYLERLSQRGWGKFSFVSTDVTDGFADVKLEHSLFVLGLPGHRGKLCYMFEGWFAGAMDWVRTDLGHRATSTCVEAQCAADGFDHCLFIVRPGTVIAAE